MSSSYDNQYLVLGDRLSSADGALSNVWAQIHAENINNSHAYALARVMRPAMCWPGGLSSVAGTTAEKVVAVFAPTTIPSGHNTIVWSIAHQRTAGSSQVTWRLYACRKLYNGSQTFDSSLLGTENISYWANAINTTTSSSDVDTDSFSIDRDLGEVWFVLTASANVSSTTAKLHTLSISSRLE